MDGISGHAKLVYAVALAGTTRRRSLGASNIARVLT